MARTLHLLTAPLLTAGLLLAAAAPAAGAPPERFPLDFSASGQSDDFCGAGIQPDFTYDQSGTGTLRWRDGVPYFQGRTSIVQTFTYDGMTVTRLLPRLLEKDLSVTDNGDGTWTIIVLFTGADRTVDEQGRILAKDDGQIRERWIYDEAVDDIVSRERIFGSTGTNDDFCAAVLEHWGL